MEVSASRNPEQVNQIKSSILKDVDESSDPKTQALENIKEFRRELPAGHPSLALFDAAYGRLTDSAVDNKATRIRKVVETLAHEHLNQ